MSSLKYIIDWKRDDGKLMRVRVIDTQSSSRVVVTEHINIESARIVAKDGDKTNSIFSSSLELTLFATRSMQFLTLYTADIFKYKINLYNLDAQNNETLVWSGFLDSEVYEEPYNYNQNYAVKISATNFGSLNRLKVDLESRLTSLWDIIIDSIKKSKIDFNAIYFSNSIKPQNSRSTNALSDVYVTANNFDDKTIDEMLSGVLFALGLKMTYLNGAIYIFDWDTLSKQSHSYLKYSSRCLYLGKETISHNLGSINDTMLGIDANVSIQPTYVKAELTLSANSEESAVKAGAGDKYTNLIANRVVNYPGQSYAGFEVNTYSNNDTKTLMLIDGEKCKWAKFDSFYSTPNINGIISYYYSDNISGVAWQTEPKFINTDSENSFQLRVKVPILLSVSYNPFEAVSVVNDEGHNKRMNERSNMIYFLCDLLLVNAAGDVLYYYKNSPHMPPQGVGTVNTWVRNVSGIGYEKSRFYLSYYKNDRIKQSPAGGKMVNSYDKSWHPIINKDPLTPFEQKNLNNGTIVPAPPEPGNIVLKMYNGFFAMRGDSKEKPQAYIDFKWLVYEGAEIIVEDKSKGRAFENEDTIFDCSITETAKDNYQHSLIIGTNEDNNPMSKSALMYKFNGSYKYCKTFTKNNKTGSLEEHNISNLFSNFAQKQIAISTSCKSNFNFGYYSELNKKLFKIYSEIDLCTMESKSEFVEFSESNYSVNNG